MKVAAISAATFWFVGVLFEGSVEATYVSMASYLIALLSSMASVVIACLAFRSASNVRKKEAYGFAACQAVTPFLLVILCYVCQVPTNMHDVAMPSLFFCGCFTELSALILLVVGTTDRSTI